MPLRSHRDLLWLPASKEQRWVERVIADVRKEKDKEIRTKRKKATSRQREREREKQERENRTARG